MGTEGLLLSRMRLALPRWEQVFRALQPNQIPVFGPSLSLHVVVTMNYSNAHQRVMVPSGKLLLNLAVVLPSDNIESVEPVSRDSLAT